MKEAPHIQLTPTELKCNGTLKLWMMGAGLACANLRSRKRKIKRPAALSHTNLQLAVQ